MLTTVNTDETRIFQDHSSQKPFMKSVLKDSGSGSVPSNVARFASTENFEDVRDAAVRQNEREDSGIEKDFSNLVVEDNNLRPNFSAIGTSTKNNSSQSTNAHRLGVVPRYSSLQISLIKLSGHITNLTSGLTR